MSHRILDEVRGQLRRLEPTFSQTMREGQELALKFIAATLRWTVATLFIIGYVSRYSTQFVQVRFRALRGGVIALRRRVLGKIRHVRVKKLMSRPQLLTSKRRQSLVRARQLAGNVVLSVALAAMGSYVVYNVINDMFFK